MTREKPGRGYQPGQGSHFVLQRAGARLFWKIRLKRGWGGRDWRQWWEVLSWAEAGGPRGA